MQEFISTGVVGAAFSLALEYLQARWGMNSKESRLIALAGSIMLGSALWYVMQFEAVWQAILGVLGVASTMYAMFFSDRHRNADGSLNK